MRQCSNSADSSAAGASFTASPMKPTKPRAALQPHQIAKLRAETMLDERTIRAWARGEPKMKQSTLAALSRAAAKFGIEAAS